MANTVVPSISLDEAVVFEVAIVGERPSVSMMGLNKTLVLDGLDETVVFEGEAMGEDFGGLMLPVDGFIVLVGLDRAVVLVGEAIDGSDL